MYTVEGDLKEFDPNKNYLVERFTTDSPCGGNSFHFIHIYDGEESENLFWDYYVGHYFWVEGQRYLEPNERDYIKSILSKYYYEDTNITSCPYKMIYESDEAYGLRTIEHSDETYVQPNF